MGMRVSSGKIYTLENLEIDAVQVVVRCGGEERRLRPKTFQLLIYLIEHRDRLVPKEELIRELWPDTAVSDGALAQCIASIRKALGEDPRNPRLIRTAARLGCQFTGHVQQASPCQSLAIEEITERRVEYSEETVEDEPPPLETPRAALLAPPSARRRRRLKAGNWIALLVFAALCFVAVLGAWKHWGRAYASHKPEWWEAAWWKLNEASGSKISDSVHGLTASLPAGVSWAPGVAGSALFFTGQEFVRGADPDRVLPGWAAARTLTAWLKTGSTNAEQTPILVEGDTNPDSPAGFAFSIALDERGAAGMGTGHYLLAGKTHVDDGRWHQIAGVFEGEETRRMRVFVDGAEEANTQLPFRFTPGRLSRWTLGTKSGGVAAPTSIDDARIYERALRPEEIRSLYRCMAGASDIDIEGRGSFYFAPIFGDRAEILPRAGNSATVKNAANDLSGVMLVKRDPDCGLRSIHGANVGQDLSIKLNLLVPPGPTGVVTAGGPYFRSRRANPGDGIVGGASAGFWVHLDSTGRTRVQRLNPNGIVAYSNPPDRFDSSVFHTLEIAVHAETLEVALDGEMLSFEARGVQHRP